MRVRPSPDPFEPFIDYVTARLREDPHLWARTLLDELEELGFPLSYPSLTRNIRQRGLRPDCEVCRSATDRVNAIIPHEAGGVERAHRALSAPAPGVSPPAGERRTDRRAAKTVWILELPGRSGTIHLMHHCPGFACSYHDLRTSGAVHKSFIAKLSADGPTSNCCAVQHDSEYGAVYW